MKDHISESEYHAAFSNKAEALKNALEIRKFEIDLYWKRAAYFWTFIGATFAAYGAVQASSIPSKNDLAVVLACLGFVFSFGWFCVNKGSKQWQENWENHVDLLEDGPVGPLYKIILQRPDPKGRWWVRRWATGPASLSVSKINQIISLFVAIVWIFMLWTTLPGFSLAAAIDWEYITIIAIAALACVGFVTWGKTDFGKPHRLVAFKRISQIDPKEPVASSEGEKKPQGF